MTEALRIESSQTALVARADGAADGGLRGGPPAEDVVLSSRWRLTDHLGTGGCGEVWKAHDGKTHECVAAKLLKREHSDSDPWTERFVRGADAMWKLKEHPHIVTILHRVAKSRGLTFFVMEFMEGGDFYRFVTRNEPKPDGVLDLILKVGDALGTAHQAGILHRDVKPQNILLDPYGEPKLGDFDLARIPESDSITGSRGHLGTIPFAAPELMGRAKSAGVSADVYGLGMVAVFAFAGGELPDNVDRTSVRSQLIEGLAVPSQVQRVVAKATAEAPAARYSAVNEFCTELAGAFDEAAEEHRAEQRRERIVVRSRILVRAIVGTVCGIIVASLVHALWSILVLASFEGSAFPTRGLVLGAVVGTVTGGGLNLENLKSLAAWAVLGASLGGIVGWFAGMTVAGFLSMANQHPGWPALFAGLGAGVPTLMRAIRRYVAR